MRQLEISDCQPHRLRNPGGPGGACFWKNHGELLTAIARSQINLALGKPTYCRSHQLKVLIASLMSLGIVKRLKVINIEHQERDCRTRSLQASAFHLKCLVKHPPVSQSGQRIEGR